MHVRARAGRAISRRVKGVNSRFARGGACSSAEWKLSTDEDGFADARRSRRAVDFRCHRDEKIHSTRPSPAWQKKTQPDASRVPFRVFGTANFPLSNSSCDSHKLSGETVSLLSVCNLREKKKQNSVTLPSRMAELGARRRILPRNNYPRLRVSRASDNCRVSFTGCRIPPRALWPRSPWPRIPIINIWIIFLIFISIFFSLFAF